jgi:general secretion pathway protein G
MKYHTKEKRTGFTLIELLVVVSLIGVLATLVLANLNAARQRGRDAQRKSDLRNIQTALRLYYNDYNKYPDGTSTIYGCGGDGTSECDWGDSFESGIQTYMSTLPDDPLSDVSYSYQQIDADDYILTACLENPSDEKGQPSGTCSSGWEYVVQP